MLFRINKPAQNTHSFTREDNQLIYNYLKENKTPLEIKQLLGFPGTTNQVVKIENEIQRVEAEIVSKVKGSFVETPYSIDEDGKETKAVYFSFRTKKELIDSIDSFLNVNILCSDVEDYYKEYKQNRSFTEFKNLVKEE